MMERESGQDLPSAVAEKEDGKEESATGDIFDPFDMMAGMGTEKAYEVTLLKEGGNSDEIAPTLQVFTMAGEPVDVDIACSSIKEIRSRVALAVHTSANSVKLFSGSMVLSDAAPLSQIGSDGIIRMLLVSPGPSWYPSNKYLHDGKEVLKIIRNYLYNRGDITYSYDIQYTDGSSYFMESDNKELFDLPQKLTTDWGFITHQTKDYSDFPVQERSWEAVPSEDPDDWESWTEQYGGHGKRRVVSKTKD